MYTIIIIGPIVTSTAGPGVAGCNVNEESIKVPHPRGTHVIAQDCYSSGDNYNSHNQSLSITQNTFGKTVNGRVFLTPVNSSNINRFLTLYLEKV